MLGIPAVCVRGLGWRTWQVHRPQSLLVEMIHVLTSGLSSCPPAMMRPKQLWSGKQVLSTVFINLVPWDKTPPKIKPKELCLTEPRSVSAPSPSIMCIYISLTRTLGAWSPKLHTHNITPLQSSFLL